MGFRPDNAAVAAPAGRFRPDSAPAPRKQPRVVQSLGDVIPGEVEGTDYVFDKPAAAAPAQPSLLRTAGGVLDNVLPAITSIPAAAAESAARLTGFGPQGQRAAADAFQIRPFTQAGRDVEASATAAVAPKVAAILNRGAAALDSTGIPNLSRDVGALLQTAGDVGNVAGVGAPLAMLGREAAAASSAAKGFRDSAKLGSQRTPEQITAAGGFKVRPSDVEAAGGKPGTMAKLGETVGGSSPLKRDYILNNLEATERMAVEELGLPGGTKLTEDVFRRVEAPHAEAYNAIERIPQIDFDQNFIDELTGIGSGNPLTSTPPAVTAMQEDILRNAGASGKNLRMKISDLRQQARDNLATGAGEQVAPRDRTLGKAQIAAANALEGLLERKVPPDMLDAYRKARQSFAVTNMMRRAQTLGERIDPQVIAREAEINPAINGRMKIVADQADRYPKVFSASVPETGSDAQGMLARLGSGAAAGAMGGGALFGLPGAVGGAAAGVAIPSVVRKIMGRTSPAADIEAAAPTFFQQPIPRTVRPPPEPQAPVPPSGLFADELAPPTAMTMPAAGRPEPGTLPFNQLLADQMAGDLTLEGALPPAPAPRAPGGRPLDTIDFAPPVPPAAPGQALPPLTQEQLRLAPEQPLSLVDERPLSIAAMLDESLPLDATGAGRGIQGSFADQLGPVAPRMDELLFEDPRGMPTRPRGVSGPRSAQLTDPRLPRGLELVDDTPPPQPMFGPGDEFPGPAGGSFSELIGEAAPAQDLIGDRLYRGVPEGMDPNAPNERGFTTWSNQRDVASQYGPNIGETQFDPSTNVHLGTLEDARQLLGLPREATAQDIAEAAMRRFMGANQTASYDLPPELGGTPREFIRFGPQ